MSQYAWNQRFETWARPLSATEDQKCQNAENVIRSALDADRTLAQMHLRVFAQGSYRANTNVRADSDLDICVCNFGTFYTQYPAGVTDIDVGYGASDLTFVQFKNLVGQALYSRFGYSGVTRGDKAFNVHENSYRIKADVVPTFEFRDFHRRYDGTLDHRTGVRFVTDKEKIITNWPRQTLDNGVDKNNRTRRYFKQVVRVLKGLRNEMQEAGISGSKDIGSFLIESLIWNVPDSYFSGDSLYDIVKKVTGHAWYVTNAIDRSSQFCEVNDIKYLFHSTQPHTRQQANEFLLAVIQYVGFIY